MAEVSPAATTVPLLLLLLLYLPRPLQSLLSFPLTLSKPIPEPPHTAHVFFNALKQCALSLSWPPSTLPQ